MKGIVGIVASRLIETYYRPTVVLTMSNGYVTGSARSVPGFRPVPGRRIVRRPVGKFRRTYLCGRPDDAARKRGRVHAAVQRLCRGAHRSRNADPAGGDRLGIAVQRHHAQIPDDVEPFPTVRPGKQRAGIRNARRQQPRRRPVGRGGAGTPENGPDPGTETEHIDPGHRVPATDPLRACVRANASTSAIRSSRTTTGGTVSAQLRIKDIKKRP